MSKFLLRNYYDCRRQLYYDVGRLTTRPRRRLQGQPRVMINRCLLATRTSTKLPPRCSDSLYQSKLSNRSKCQ